jgi:predicted DNA-binding transcriptional regulator YafY
LYPSLSEDFLKSILDDTVSKAYLIKGHNYEDISDKKDEFKLLEDAILNQKRVSFIYSNKQRILNPYKLVNKDGIWYLVGVENDETLKTYSFKKTSKIELLDSTFEQDTKIIEIIQSDDNVWFSQKQTEVVLKVDKSIAQYFKRRKVIANQSILKELEDGSLLVSCKVSFNEEILKIVRYWIPNVEIISPDDLQDKLQKSLIAYLK